MSQTNKDNPPDKKRRWRKALRCIAIAAAGIVAAVIILTVGASLYLTPRRLTRIVNREASRLLRADVEAFNVDYTFWKTFPRLHLSADSLIVKSRTLEGLDSCVRRQLPPDCDFLVSTGKIETGINVWKALRREAEIPEIMVASPVVNIVAVNDSINNFSILPASLSLKDVPPVRIKKIYVPSPVSLSFFSLSPDCRADIILEKLRLSKESSSPLRFAISLDAKATATAGGHTLTGDTPATIAGALTLCPAPLRLTLSDFEVSAAGIKTVTSLDLTAENPVTVNSLHTHILSEDILSSLRRFNLPLPAIAARVSGSLPIELKANLDKPYRITPDKAEELSAGSLPAFTSSLRIADGKLSATSPTNKIFRLSGINLSAIVDVDPSRPRDNRLEIINCSLKSDSSSLNASALVDELLSGNPLMSANIKYRAGLMEITRLFMPDIPVKIEGTLTGEADISCRMADIMNNDFNNMAVDTKTTARHIRIYDTVKKLTASLSDISLHLSSKSKKSSVATPTEGMPGPVSSARFSPRYSTQEDSLIASRTHHTPLYLVPGISGPAREVVRNLCLNADLSIGEGALTIPSYPAVTAVSSLHVVSDIDSVEIKNLNVRSRSSEARISGKVTGLRDFISSPSPSLLSVNLDASFPEINVNELAGTYYDGVANLSGHKVDYHVAAPGAYSEADSICVVIPRNLLANLRLRADRAVYKEWSFSPLSTEITVHDGDAKIGALNIGADYGSAVIDWTYSTQNLNNIFMHLDAELTDFDFQHFLSAFPALAEETPELRNISGHVSATADGHFLMFPDMFLNTPSLTGSLTLSADSLSYARDKKTARITHWMLIKGDGPLKIDDFKARCTFHDNLLQVEPFTLGCGGYEVMLGGVNNLRGEIYYHIGLMHSPFHIPFGINLVGHYRHPSIRFGGKGIKDGRERKIAADLRDSVNINIMRQLRHGWLLFVKSAAGYDASESDPLTAESPQQ